MAVIHNPVLSGFNPDPSIERVGDDYYIITSSFEWFPGIPIYHSRDLMHWRHIGFVLTRTSQLNLTRCNDSMGIYAPMLRYHDGLFHVVYTVVSQSQAWPLNYYPNYVVTSEKAAGPYSEPVFLNSLGFDPSLFFDNNGRAYCTFRMFDHRNEKKPSPGIGLHEFNPKTFEPVGPPRIIYEGQWLNHDAEGPHLYKHEEYYYLMTAEGGTGYAHAETLARAENIWGPYEKDPEKVIITSHYDPALPIQKAGHASLVCTCNDEWYIAHLASRPPAGRRKCPLGRETFLQKVVWTDDGWLRLWHGGKEPRMETPAPDLPEYPFQAATSRDDFRSGILDLCWLTLREPIEKSWCSLLRKPGALSIRGRAGLSNTSAQSLIAQRMVSFNACYETKVHFEPEDFRHAAGLICYYHTACFYYLAFTYNEKTGACLDLIHMDPDKKWKELLKEKIPVGQNAVSMRMELTQGEIQFYYSLDNTKWLPVGGILDFSLISDEHANGYTGAMIGLCVQDMIYEQKWAEFEYFRPIIS